jgi:alpha-1,3-glucan synthase
MFLQQDNFRWPSITQGVERELLGFFITTLFLPGIPLVYYGQEQGLYVMDNTADNYIFGRQPMSPAPAWKMHGCYNLGSSQYIDWPVDQGRRGCEDEGVPRDHRDPSRKQLLDTILTPSRRNTSPLWPSLKELITLVV